MPLVAGLDRCKVSSHYPKTYRVIMSPPYVSQEREAKAAQHSLWSCHSCDAGQNVRDSRPQLRLKKPLACRAANCGSNRDGDFEWLIVCTRLAHREEEAEGYRIVQDGADELP
jgi:hypothetical protein